MKLLLIKLGKALNTLRRDGLIRGGKRVGKAFLAMFHRAGSGDILFITGGVGDSALYRCHHQAEELSLHGFECSVAVQDNIFLSRYVHKFNIFIFHRVLLTHTVQRIIEKIKEQKKEIIFETDDLVFDPKYIKYMDYFKQMNALEKKLYEEGVGGEILCDPYVRICTTTTSFLEVKLKEYDKKVFISKNKLSNADLEIAEAITRRKQCHPELVEGFRSNRKGRNNIVKIGYFSGTISHNKDFAVITCALMKIMGKYSNVELFLVGPLDIDNNFNRFKNRVKRLHYVPRVRHFENISHMDINLAPLEIGNPFCEAKSEVKFFEAGILGIPTVASATQTFQEVISDGKDGFIANTQDEWIEKLEKLIISQELRKKMGEEARIKSLREYTMKNSYNEEYYNYLRNVVEFFPSKTSKNLI